MVVMQNGKIFFIFVPIDVNTNDVFMFKFTNFLYVYRVLDSQTCLTHVHTLDILKL